MDKRKIKQATDLLELYVMLWQLQYGKEPVVNRNVSKWGFVDMIEDLGFTKAKQTIEYYFTTGKHQHPLQHLFTRYDKLYENAEAFKKDEAERARLREETKKRVAEWKANLDKS